MKNSYTLNVAGLKRELPFFKVSDDLTIAAFIMFGDVELTEHCAKALLEKAPLYEIMITAEAKSIPLIYEMAKQAGRNNYVDFMQIVLAYWTFHIAHFNTSDNSFSSPVNTTIGKDCIFRSRAKPSKVFTGNSMTSASGCASANLLQREHPGCDKNNFCHFSSFLSLNKSDSYSSFSVL